jgi:nucleotide-binding universal stress UspA family protein
MIDRKRTTLEKILVPLDGSELSDRILTQVKRLLVRHDAEVMLVSVLSPRELERESVPGREIEAARRHLGEIASALRGQGANVESDVAVGEPAERIHAFALEYRPSVIAMSTHGRTGVSRWIRGSVAERVLRVTPFPLLLANPFGLAEREERRFRRILVPLDGSPASAEILPLVKDFASHYESEVLLHVAVEIPAVEPLVYPLMISTEDAQKRLEAFRAELPGIRVQTSASLGSPAGTIVDTAEREKVDLVAMTTHGRTGASRWAFGSVAEQVIRHCPCPLLVKRTGGFERQATE